MSECPECLSEGAYVGAHDVECPNPKCRHYKEPAEEINEVKFHGSHYQVAEDASLEEQLEADHDFVYERTKEIPPTEPLQNTRYWSHHWSALIRFADQEKWLPLDVYFSEETGEIRSYLAGKLFLSSLWPDADEKTLINQAISALITRPTPHLYWTSEYGLRLVSKRIHNHTPTKYRGKRHK